MLKILTIEADAFIHDHSGYFDNQKDEIIGHFEFVYDSLSNLKSEDLNKLQLTNRTKHLNSLKKYMTRGIIP